MTHARRTYECTCGKVVTGNGGKSSHRRSCSGRYFDYYERYEKAKAEWEAAHPEVAAKLGDVWKQMGEPQ